MSVREVFCGDLVVQCNKSIACTRNSFGWVAKLHRAFDKVRKLTEGFLSLSRSGFEGVHLHEDYWQELLVEQHFCPPKSQFLRQQWEVSECDLAYESWLESSEGKESMKVYQQVVRSEHQPDFSDTVRSFLGEVRYLTDKQLKKYKVEVTNIGGEIFLIQNGRRLINKEDRSEQTFIFVINVLGEIYACHPVGNLLHHSSLGRGKLVISAGELIVDVSGHLIEVTNLSGHYRPGRKQTLNALSILASRGIDLTKVKLSVYDKGMMLHYKEGERYLVDKGECCSDEESPISGGVDSDEEWAM